MNVQVRVGIAGAIYRILRDMCSNLCVLAKGGIMAEFPPVGVARSPVSPGQPAAEGSRCDVRQQCIRMYACHDL
jgi:hypothetical protein